MSANWFTTSNEKLHFAALMLEQATAGGDDDRIGDLRRPVWRQACLEACVFHLRAAQLAYLAEVAAAHELGEAPLSGLDELRQRAAGATETGASAVLTELNELAADASSWWSRFETCWRSLQGARPESERRAAAGAEHITIATDADSDWLSAPFLQDVIDALGELRERQREDMREW